MADSFHRLQKATEDLLVLVPGRYRPVLFQRDFCISLIDNIPSAMCVTNEPIGATATLIAERWRESDIVIPRSTAVLLGCAISSNTLAFTAPSTHPRDREAYRWLATTAAVPETLLSKMRSARRRILTKSSIEIVLSDAKIFPTAYGSILMSQVEAHGASAVAEREDIVEALNLGKEVLCAPIGLLNLVDTETNISVIISSDPEVWKVLKGNLPLRRQTSNTAAVYKIILRKSHLVPILTRHPPKSPFMSSGKGL